MRSELERVRRGVPRPVELYSAFYISVCCQKLPPPANMDASTTSSPTSSPETSPKGAKKSESLVTENQQLKLQLKAAQAQATEAHA